MVPVLFDILVRNKNTNWVIPQASLKLQQLSGNEEGEKYGTLGVSPQQIWTSQGSEKNFSKECAFVMKSEG